MNEDQRFAELLARTFPLSAQQIEALRAHYCLLVRWNRVLNLTRVVSPEEAVTRHYGESLFLGAQLPPEPVSILDVGAGPGFPGVPVAVLRPDCRVTLAESHKRKAVFLREATRSVHNIDIFAKRAEYLRNDFDWVISRAVRWEEVLPLALRHVGLLLGAQDASAASANAAFAWREPLPLPWGRERLLLLGSRKPDHQRDRRPQ